MSADLLRVINACGGNKLVPDDTCRGVTEMWVGSSLTRNGVWKERCSRRSETERTRRAFCMSNSTIL